MTLKEIEKLIDEANVVYNENKTGFGYYLHLKEFKDKTYHKLYFKDYIEAGNVLYYYNRNKDTGEMKLLAKVDHIDKEKKIVKKKLDDMTQEEIEQVSGRICFENSCQKCPFTDNNNLECLAGFLDWKKRYLDNKDREFEIEEEAKDEKEN